MGGLAWLQGALHPDLRARPAPLIVDVATTVAATGDVDTVTARHPDLAGVDLRPDEQVVDAGSTSVDHVLAAPPTTVSSWSARCRPTPAGRPASSRA